MWIEIDVFIRKFIKLIEICVNIRNFTKWIEINPVIRIVRIQICSPTWTTSEVCSVRSPKSSFPSLPGYLHLKFTC